MSRSFHTCVFSHGKESGPWGAKIVALADVARSLGVAVESIDYRGIDDPRQRVDKLLAMGAQLPGPLVLIGSSLGGHVAAAAASRLPVRGLFLLAPAFYMPGFEAHTPRDVPCPAALVHGWNDDIVPVEHSIRWAREQHAMLTVLESDHRLQDCIDDVAALFRRFLESLG
jgi:pimeloyl-ACP methyl ester carboxylesterase